MKFTNPDSSLPEDVSRDHVKDPAGGSDHDMLALLKLPHILPHTGSSDTGVALGPHVVSKGHDDLLDLLGQLPGGGQDQSLEYFKGLSDWSFFNGVVCPIHNGTLKPFVQAITIFHIIDQIKV